MGGEVSIDVSPENSPEATIRKMQTVRSAALAPADPSPQDRAVASRAAQLEAQARMEKMEQQEERRKEQKTGAAVGLGLGLGLATKGRAAAAYDTQSGKAISGALVNLFG